MKKFALIALIVVIAALFTACSTSYYDTIKYERQVIEAACEEMHIPTQGVKLQFLKGEILSIGRVIYYYEMTIPNGRRFVVSAWGRDETFGCQVGREVY